MSSVLKDWTGLTRKQLKESCEAEIAKPYDVSGAFPRPRETLKSSVSFPSSFDFIPQALTAETEPASTFTQTTTLKPTINTMEKNLANAAKLSMWDTAGLKKEFTTYAEMMLLQPPDYLYGDRVVYDAMRVVGQRDTPEAEAERQLCAKVICRYCEHDEPLDQRKQIHVHSRVPCSASAIHALNDPQRRRRTIEVFSKSAVHRTPHVVNFSDSRVLCDVCGGSGRHEGVTCWHCEGEGVDPSK